MCVCVWLSARVLMSLIHALLASQRGWVNMRNPLTSCLFRQNMLGSPPNTPSFAKKTHIFSNIFWFCFPRRSSFLSCIDMYRPSVWRWFPQEVFHFWPLATKHHRPPRSLSDQRSPVWTAALLGFAAARSPEKKKNIVPKWPRIARPKGIKQNNHQKCKTQNHKTPKSSQNLWTTRHPNHPHQTKQT